MSKAKRLVGIIFAVLFAVSAFGCAAATPTHARAGQAQQSGASLQEDVALSAATGDELSAYLFVYFVSDGRNGGNSNTNPDGEQIYFSVSPNGANWEPLNGGKPILRSTVGEHGVRDPHIVRKPDGSGFYLIATDLSIDHGELYVSREGGWGGSQKEGSRAIIVWESADLVNWSDPRRCEISREYATSTWAPESIWDPEKNAYMVFWSSKTTEGWHFRVYRCYTTDFVTFTEPEVYIEREESFIDTSFIEADGWYYRFSKNEAVGKYIIMEKSRSLSGPFTIVNTFTVNGVNGPEYTSNSYPGSTGYEGPTGFKMNGENKWYLLLDGLNENQGYKPFITDNIAEGHFVSATAFTFGGVDFRHGSCIPITGNEYSALLSKYSKEPEAGSGDMIFSLDFEDNLTVGGTKSSTFSATAYGTVPFVDGYKGKAAKINNVAGNFIELSGGANNPLAGLTTATISFAVNIQSQSTSWVFFAAPNANKPDLNGANQERYLGILYGDAGDRNIKVQRWKNSGSRADTAHGAYPLNEWHHVKISFYENNTVLFVDGVRIASAPAVETLGSLVSSSTSIAYIGKATWGSGEYGDFLIDNFKIYNYAMNRVQVAEHYAAEKAA